MTILIGLLVIALLGVILIQIGKISDLSSNILGEEKYEERNNAKQAFWLLVFMVVFLVGTIWSALHFKNQLLGYGPLKAASEHGSMIDDVFNTTLIPTGIIFVITHILLFWYAYKYHKRRGHRAKFISHNNTLELLWTIVPVIVMTFLVVKGMIVWNKVMPDIDSDTQYLEIEATGYQFAWDIRYPGPDGVLGNKDYRLIDPANNSLGIDWSDPASHDDVILGGTDMIVLPVDTTIRVRITSKDVLHNFYLPHFRVKMDAVPGLPTYFVFRPTKTTAEFRKELKKYPEWNEPYDPEDPKSNPRWKEFNFELACAELCGVGHYSMRRVVKIVTQDEYKAWEKDLKATYLASGIKKDGQVKEKMGEVMESEPVEMSH